MPILGWAQSAPTAGRSTTEKTKDETIVLSPFVVTSDGNNGYAATSTLAGTRLNTKLRDLGAAITVVTPEFMKDTGVTSIEELLT
ncbi:MAG: hypothetical protein PSU94_06275 [Lacunisphaera sp.]|nr:hypothetical protein [Lacunisphaera sp.]